MLITTNDILLKASKSLRHTIGVMMCLNVVLVLALFVENIISPENTIAGWIEYTTLFSFLALAVTIFFLCSYTRLALPKNETEVLIYKQSPPKNSTILVTLLCLQILTIFTMYLFEGGWFIFEIFKLLYFLSPDAYPYILFFFLQIFIVAYGVRFILQTFKLRLLWQHNQSKNQLQKQLTQCGKLAKATGIIAIAFLLLYLTCNIYVEITRFQYLSVVSSSLIGFKEIFFSLNIILIAVLCIALSQKFHIDNFASLNRLCRRISLFISINLAYYLVVCIPKEYAWGSYLLLFAASLAVLSQAVLMYVTLRMQIITEKINHLESLSNAANGLQKAFATDVLFTRAFGKVDDENNEAAKSYFQFAVETCNRKGNIYSHEYEASLGWIMGQFFPPTPHNDMLMKYEEVKLLEKHEATPERIIADNAQNFAYIWLLGTTPKARCKGLGKILLEKTLNQLRKLAIEECWLSTENSSNVEYYKKFGFELFTEQISELGVTTYVMVNKLPIVQ